MKKPDHLSPRDLERLSAYLDGECSSKEAAKLEARLQVEPGLRQALEELRATANLLRALPEVPPPRSFALTPEMVGVKQRRRAYPVLRLATALASVAFVALIGLDALTTVVLPLAGGFRAAQVLRDAGPPEAAEFEAPLIGAEAPLAESEISEEQERFFGEEQDEVDLLQMTAECTEWSEGFAAPGEGEANVEGTPKCKGILSGMPAPGVGTELPEPTETEEVVDTEPVAEAPERGLGVPDWSYWRIGLCASEVFFGISALVLASLMLWTRRK